MSRSRIALPGLEAEVATYLLLTAAVVGYFLSGPDNASFLIGAGLLLGTVTFAAARWCAGDILVFMRLAVIGLPGMFAAAIIGWDDSNIIANHLVRFQTKEMAARVLFLSVAAMASSLAVWLFVARRTRLHPRTIVSSDRVRLILYAVGGVGCGVLAMGGVGTPIWSDPYASVQGAMPLQLNILGGIAIFSLVGMIAHAYFSPRITVGGRRGLILGAFILTTIVFTIRGKRAELIMLSSGLGAIAALWRRWNPSVALLAAAALLAMSFSAVWGAYRPVAATGTGFGEVTREFATGLIEGGGHAYQGRQERRIAQSLPSQYIYHLFGVIGLIEEGSLEHWYGRSYGKYLEMTPPKSLYPNRPDDLSWLFVAIGETSGGAFPELAEAYLNFGLVGVILIPALISLLYFHACRRALELWTPDAVAWYGVLATLVVRTTLYGTFSLYKGLLAFVILQTALVLFERAVGGVRARNTTTRLTLSRSQ